MALRASPEKITQSLLHLLIPNFLAPLRLFNLACTSISKLDVRFIVFATMVEMVLPARLFSVPTVPFLTSKLSIVIIGLMLIARLKPLIMTSI